MTGSSLFALCAGLAFLIQWIAFVPAYLRRTEVFFDLTGSLTYIAVMAIAVWLSPTRDARAWLLFALVTIWALRLGSFLFRRILAAGSDRRFAAITPSFTRFLATWTLQGLWVTGTLAAALAAIASTERAPAGPFAVTGACLWLVGFAVETIADRQKARFRAAPGNAGHFIATGLWAWSRHPNYFGEILLWTGVAIVAIPNLHGGWWLSLLSPLFVYLLLTRISGIPLLERRADEQWGGDADYEAYKRNTPALFPRPPR